MTTLQSPLIAAPRGVEVCVMDRAQAAHAHRLLGEHFQKNRPRPEPADVVSKVAAVCEECGATAEFPSADRGSVQTCPHCRAYLDVPGE